MTPVSTQRDPRSIITPDAFQVSPHLLGLKLAPPGRRLAALLLDVVVIAILTAVTRSFALILGVAAAVLFIRAGFKRTPVRGTVFDRARRGAVGCLGVFIALITTTLWVSLGPGGRSNDDDEGPDVVSVGPPEGAVGADEAPAMFDRLLPAPTSEAVEPRDVGAVRDEVSLYTTEEALEAYAALLRSGRADDMDVVRRDALEARLATEIAADTLGVLQSRISALAEDVREAEEDLAETEDQLEEAQSRGLFGWFRSFLDELGFGFGWASLYFTVMLSWWKGQTVGKRLLRIRVLRLDGEPITWWVGFERAGGYAAGLATGLLGFAQICWDANRQAIHDRIVGTVVALDPPEKVLDWESVL